MADRLVSFIRSEILRFVRTLYTLAACWFIFERERERQMADTMKK